MAKHARKTRKKKPAAKAAKKTPRKTAAGGAPPFDPYKLLGLAAPSGPGIAPSGFSPKAAVYVDPDYMDRFARLYEDRQARLKQRIKDYIRDLTGNDPPLRNDLKWGLYQKAIQPRNAWHSNAQRSELLHDNWPSWSDEARESLERLPAPDGSNDPRLAWNPYDTSEVADNLLDHLDKAIRVALWDDHVGLGNRIVPLGIGVLVRTNRNRHRLHRFGTLWETTPDLVYGPNPNARLEKLWLVMLCPASGWQGYGFWRNYVPNRHITRFKAEWVVPNPPAERNDQTIFMFNCLESLNTPARRGGILQPVLQWDATSTRWYMRNWYVRADFNAEDYPDLPGPNQQITYGSADYQTQGRSFSTAIEVQPGERITGLIQRSFGSNFNYTCSISSDSGQSVPFTVSDVPELVYAACVVESYGIDPARRREQYPATRPLAFEGLDLRVDGNSIPVTWTENERVGKDFITHAAPQGDRIRMMVKP